MNRTFWTKATLLAGALVAASLLTVYHPSPQGLIPFGVGQAEVRAAPGTAAKVKANYDLTALKVFSWTLGKVRDNYVDPSREDAKGMLISALDMVQRNIAEVLVDVRDDKSVVVTVNDKQQVFDITDVDFWKMHSKLKEIFRFVQANMNPGSDASQIEYAAVNGMLQTLDPHSVLLDPDGAREMDAQTSGKFGGIGIVIGMKKDKATGENKLTVMSLISGDTPANRAGLKAGDHIVKINDEATSNLTIEEAKGRLRGDPQTKVVVTIARKGVTGTNPYELTRDVIRVTSVHAHLLSGGVGYLKIDQFSQEVAQDMKRSMEELKKQGAKAWVLDLRNNPGGLLDQAVKVADLFVDSGVIVATVGNSKGGKPRDEKRAQSAGTDHLPLAVLVNGGSASASEIVAGALKNLDRAVIVGQTTFGKGSVQVLFDNDDGSKLKLTIAQYLTPGDVSIQSVGIAPDIQLDRVWVPEKIATYKDILRLQRPINRYREADLEAHIVSKYAREGDKPSDVVRYVEPEKKKAAPAGAALPPDDDPDAPPAAAPDEEDDNPPDGTEKFNEDFQIDFARDLLAVARSPHRKDMLTETKTLVQKRKVEEEQKIVAALGKLGIDWVASPVRASGAHLVATVTTDKPGNKVTAGDVIAITGSVTNNGTAPAYRVEGVAKNDNWSFEGTELVFGKIDPGQTRTFTMYVQAPKASDSRIDGLEWAWNEDNGARVEGVPTKIAVEGLPRPQFSYAYQLVDDAANDNGDGLVQVGESLRLKVQVKNTGKGAGLATQAMLRSTSGDFVVVNKGRFDVKKVEPGETKSLEFTFDVKKEFADKDAVVELTVYDTDLREGVNEKLHFPIHAPAAGPTPVKGLVKITKATEVREGASDDSVIVGTARKGAVMNETGKQAGWVRVALSDGTQGFIPAAAVGSGGGAVTADAFTPRWQVTPPQVTLQVASQETMGDHFTLTGTASDDNHLEDVFILVSNRDSKIEGKKVFYLSNRGKKSDKKLDFSARVPVWPGNNLVTVIARENNEVKAIQSVWINREDRVATAGATPQQKTATP